MYGVDGDNLSRWYKHYISDYEEWEQRYHASEYVLFKENIGERLSMDETNLSQGELYTIVTLCALYHSNEWAFTSVGRFVGDDSV